MPKSEPTYAELVAQMRAERHERESTERLREIAAEYNDTIEQRDSSDDPQVWAIHDQAAEALEQEYQQLSPALPPAPTYTDVEADVIRKHSPAEYGRPHWTQQSKYNDQKLSNEQIVGSIAGYAQSRFVQERASRGLQTTPQDLEAYRNSADYRAALEVGEPVEQGGLPTADSIVDDIRKTSKYGRDFDAKKYNQQVRAMDRAGKRGEYDR